MKTFLLLLGLTATALAESIVVRVTDSQGQPVPNADVVAILKSGAYQNTKRATDGNYKCETTLECVKVFAAAPGYEAASKKYSGNAGAVPITLKASDTKGSAVIRRGGQLPGIDGSVNPILDNSNRTYMYSTKIGLTKSGRKVPQPVYFSLNRDIEAQTSTGEKFKIIVLDITPQVSLLEFTNPK